MYYTKPNNMKYTEMCKYFDEHFYDEKRNDYRLYKYLYLIIYMLTCKMGYFLNYDDIDAFVVYAASTIYKRYIKKQREGYHYRSVLNYVKKTLYGLKINYLVREEGKQKVLKGDYLEVSKASLQRTESSKRLTPEIMNDIKYLPTIVSKTVHNTPYGKNPIMYRRLYNSVILTILKSVTLSGENKNRLNKYIKKKRSIENILPELFKQERTKALTLWRLPNKFKDYVELLVEIVKQEFSKEIYETREFYRIDDDELTAILMTAYTQDLNDSKNNFTNND